jgi:hypothetical protein
MTVWKSFQVLIFWCRGPLVSGRGKFALCKRRRHGSLRPSQRNPDLALKRRKRVAPSKTLVLSRHNSLDYKS